MLMKRLNRNRDLDSNEMAGLNKIDTLNRKSTNLEVFPKSKPKLEKGGRFIAALPSRVNGFLMGQRGQWQTQNRSNLRSR